MCPAATPDVNLSRLPSLLVQGRQPLDEENARAKLYYLFRQMMSGGIGVRREYLHGGGEVNFY